jgi:hypothetical protein
VLRRIFQDELIVIATLIVAALSCALIGCDEKPAWQEPGPVVTFETFLMDWYRGDHEAAFSTIAPADRQRLIEPLESLEGKLDDENMPDEVDMLVVGRVDNPYDVKDVELIGELRSAPKNGEKVTLNIGYHDGREGKATLVWGGEQWFVDLPIGANPKDEDAGSPNSNQQQQDSKTP